MANYRRSKSGNPDDNYIRKGFIPPDWPTAFVHVLGEWDMFERFGEKFQWNPATLRTFVRKLDAYGGRDAGLQTFCKAVASVSESSRYQLRYVKTTENTYVLKIVEL